MRTVLVCTWMTKAPSEKRFRLCILALNNVISLFMFGYCRFCLLFFCKDDVLYSRIFQTKYQQNGSIWYGAAITLARLRSCITCSDSLQSSLIFSRLSENQPSYQSFFLLFYLSICTLIKQFITIRTKMVLWRNYYGFILLIWCTFSLLNIVVSMIIITIFPFDIWYRMSQMLYMKIFVKTAIRNLCWTDILGIDDSSATSIMT